MSSAKALSVSELLEEILLHTAQRDILLLQRVSRSWLFIITNSPRLQQRLFFQAVPSLSNPVFNPLLCEFFPPFFVLDIVPHVFENDRSPNNPSEIKQLWWYKDISMRHKVMREDASWRKMFPVLPPAKIESLMKVGGCQCVGVEFTQGWIVGTLSKNQDDEGGINMGGLWDTVVQLVDSVSEGEFFIEWMGFEFLAKSKVYDDEMELEGIDMDGGGMNVEIVEKIVLARRHAIALHFQWSHDCYPSPPEPCGLAIVNTNEKAFEFEGREKLKS